MSKPNESTSSNIAMVIDNPEQHANRIEAYALEEGTNLTQEGLDTAHGGIRVTRTFGLDKDVV